MILCDAQNRLRQVARRARRWQVRFGTLVFPVSRGRSRAATRRLAAPRGRARRWLPASPPAASLQGCPVSCRARRGIRPVVRSASLAAAQRLGRGGRRRAGAAGGGPLCRHSLARCRACRSAAVSGNAWRRGLGMGAPLVIRDCHVSRADRRADLVGVVFGFCACSLCGAGTAVLMQTAEAVLHHLISGRSSLAPVPKCLIHEAEARWGWAPSERAAGVAGHG